MVPEWRQQQIVDGARALLQSLAIPPNAIVIFDIDDTLITPAGAPYTHIIDFYNELREAGIHVGLITARSGEQRNVEATFKQLENVGVRGWRVSYFRSPSQTNVARFKLKARKNLWERGYYVIMTLGDQDWDHGEYGGFSVYIR
jgi:hypothetical protein